MRDLYKYKQNNSVSSSEIILLMIIDNDNQLKGIKLKHQAIQPHFDYLNHCQKTSKNEAASSFYTE